VGHGDEVPPGVGAVDPLPLGDEVGVPLWVGDPVGEELVCCWMGNCAPADDEVGDELGEPDGDPVGLDVGLLAGVGDPVGDEPPVLLPVGLGHASCCKPTCAVEAGMFRKKMPSTAITASASTTRAKVRDCSTDFAPSVAYQPTRPRARSTPKRRTLPDRRRL